MVERRVRDAEAASSNLVASTLLHFISLIEYGLLVKRLRRRPLTAETGVRFPYELLTINNLIAQPIEDAESQIMVLQHFLFTRVARKIACLHAYLASTAITRETRKVCFL